MTPRTAAGRVAADLWGDLATDYLPDKDLSRYQTHIDELLSDIEDEAARDALMALQKQTWDRWPDSGGHHDAMDQCRNAVQDFIAAALTALEPKP